VCVPKITSVHEVSEEERKSFMVLGFRRNIYGDCGVDLSKLSQMLMASRSARIDVALSSSRQRQTEKAGERVH